VYLQIVKIALHPDNDITQISAGKHERN